MDETCLHLNDNCLDFDFEGFDLSFFEATDVVPITGELAGTFLFQTEHV